MIRRAWVRGVGAVTPFGPTWASSLDPLADGRSAIRPVTHFDVEKFPCRTAAAISEDAGEPKIQDRRLPLALGAAREAWREAGAPTGQGKLGIFIGAESGRARLGTILALSRAAGGGKSFDHLRFGQEARPLASRIDASVASPAAVASALAKELGADGPVETLSLACASGLSAIAEAVRALQAGDCEVALCGGVGADVDPLMLAGFGIIGALSARGVSCPFDLRRDGFVVGEGAAMVVLSVVRQNAAVAVTGQGRSLDAYHLTAPDPRGDGATASMTRALKTAGRDGVDYLQAHGTSTALNDEVEAQAIRRVLGDRVGHVSSVKGALGHWIAGAGALGFLCAVEAVRSGTILPTAGLAEPDPRCALPHVMGKALKAQVSSALVNAFAFGGANCSVVVERCS
jgi:3-oxoacyl-[acyl-carrier-protein] synthase II